MNTCDTCTYWLQIEHAPHDGAPHTRRCGVFFGVRLEDPAAIEIVCGDDGNCGALATGPKFGCVHWKERVKTP